MGKRTCLTDKLEKTLPVRVVIACADRDFLLDFLKYYYSASYIGINIVKIYCSVELAAEVEAEIMSPRGVFRQDICVVGKFTILDIIDEIRGSGGSILVLGMDLPGVDSLCVAEELKKYDLSGHVILVSWFYSMLLKKLVGTLGIGYCFCMPVEFGQLCRRIRDCALLEREEKSFDYAGVEFSEELCAGGGLVVRDCDVSMGSAVNESKAVLTEWVGEDIVGSYTSQARYKAEQAVIKQKTTQLLHEIGVPANLCGHEYLRDAILMTVAGGETYGKMTKIIYPTIAGKYNKSPSSVEKAIRTALDVAWMRGKVDLLNDIFGFTINIHKGKPTNSEFIALMADYVKTLS